MNAISISQAVGRNCANWPFDVKAIHQRLMDIGKIPCYEFSGEMDDTIMDGIIAVQRHFMKTPDGVLSVGGRTIKFLNSWKVKPINQGVKFKGRLQEAWDLVNPLLPKGSYCSSGYRSIEDQRRILHDFYKIDLRKRIITQYGQTKYNSVLSDLIANEDQVLKMVRGVGQKIAAPGMSKHQSGKAIDIGGPEDQKQVDIIKMVAKAHDDLFSGFVLQERNGCVHFEIK